MNETITAIHFADLHLSEVNLEQTKPALDFIVNEVQERCPDLVVCAGDLIVKRGFITPSEDFIIKSAFLKMADVCQVVVIPGNHDSPNRYDRKDAVTGILMAEGEEHLRSIHPNIHTATGMASFNLGVDEKRFRVFTLPHPSKYFYLAHNENENGEEINSVIAAKIRDILLGYEASKGNGIPTILVGHGTIAGGLSDSEMVMTTENDIAIDRGWLPKFSAIMYGHLHRHQQVGNAVYSGSPAPLTFSSEGIEPAYLLWHIPGDGVGLSAYKEVAIPIDHQLLTLDIKKEEFSNDSYTPMEILKRILEEYNIKDAKVRLRYQIPEDMASLINKAELHTYMDTLGAFEHKIVDEAISAIKVRAEHLDQSLSVDAMLDTWASLDPDRKEHLTAIKQIAEEVDRGIPSEERFKFQGTDYRLTRIKAQNFKPLMDVDVQFENLGKIICISGENRAGKSQFAELERFALWKELRKGTLLSDVVRHGSNDCKVSLWFSANGNDYRVDRSIKLDGRGNAKADLVFAGRKNGKFEPLNEGTATETQEAIERVVGTYSMYRTTRFGSQKEVSLLVNMLPSEMKDTLQEAINVGIFDVRNKVASEISKDLHRGYENTRAKATDLEGQVAHKSDVEAQLTMTEERKEHYQGIMKELQTEITKVKEKFTESNRAKERVEELKEAKNKHSSDIANTDQTISRKKTILENEDKVNAGIKRTQKVRNLISEFRKKQDEYQRTKLELSEKHKKLMTNQLNLKNDRANITTEIEKLKWSRQNIIDERKKELSLLKDKISEYTQSAQLVDEVPCVDTDMNETCQLLQSARKSRSQAELCEKNLKELTDNPPDTKSLDEQIQTKETRKIELDKEIKTIEEQIENLTDVEEKRLEKIGFDPDELKNLGTELSSLEEANYSQLKEELLVADEQIKSLEKEKERLQGELEKVETEYWKLVPIANKYDELVEKDRILVDKYADVESNKNIFIERIGKIKQELESIKVLEEKLKNILTEIEKEGEKIKAYQMYIAAVSRDGIPFLLLEKVLSRFEQYANDFLCVDEGFPNILRIKVNPLRETRSGKIKDEVVIRFIDDRGEHPLGESSGFQEVAIGYALRAAMAKIQAAATGTQIKHCFFDEGWGACDDQNILLGKRMIQKFGGEFGQFFYITHRNTLKEVADTQIIITPIAGGARVEVS